MLRLFFNDLKIIVKEAYVPQLIEDKPFALLGQTADFLTSQPLQKLPNGLGYPYGDDFRFLFHDPIIDVCGRLSM